MTDTAIRFGRFTLRELLGGGMSLVYRARRDGDNEDVALKLLRNERLIDGEARARFQREADALRAIAHPGLCPLFDAGDIDGVPFLCMPLLPGRTLATELHDLRQRRSFGDWRRMVQIGIALAEALHAAHRQGLVHRDIKPANVMLTDERTPVLLDFGLVHDCAARLRALTRTGQMVGTPTYMAPEQIDERLGPVGAATDVYGLGATLFEALTTSPPFDTRNRAALFAAILQQPPDDVRRFRRELPASLAAVLAMALAKSPHWRYRSAAAFAADLRAVLCGGRIAARRPSLRQRASLLLRHHPGAVAAGCALALAATAVGTATVQLLAADTAVAQLDAAVGQRASSGRAALALASWQLLPPPWPEHAPALQHWLASHRELLAAAAPTDADPAATRLATAIADVELRLHLTQVAAVAAAEHATAWSTTIADLAADPRFANCPLAPLPGLVPLGNDPESRLPEFYDLASAEPGLAVPDRDANGNLVLLDGHGIVFVLLPGGLHRALHGDETIALTPFLCSKHELTRTQHARLATGHDPSRWPIGPLPNGEPATHRHPVDQVRFDEVLALLQRFGLCLPTEAQWEHAVVAAAPPDGGLLTGNHEGPADGFRAAAPVGRFRANGFGLHDLVGNLSELCLDDFHAILQPCRAGDGLRRLDPTDLHRVVRGSNFGTPGPEIRLRSEIRADQRLDTVGVRVVRNLEAR